MSGNATTSCGAVEGLSRELLDVFFEAQCLANSTSSAALCPVQSVSDFLDTTCGENRVEAQVGSALGLLLMVMLLQVGGVPAPSDGLGKAMWGVYMLSMLLQWLCVLFSLLMVIVAYEVVTSNYGECLKPFSGDLSLLSIVASGTFFFQPVVLMKLLAMAMYAVGMAEGIKLYSACNPKADFEGVRTQIFQPNCCDKCFVGKVFYVLLCWPICTLLCIKDPPGFNERE